MDVRYPNHHAVSVDFSRAAPAGNGHPLQRQPGAREMALSAATVAANGAAVAPHPETGTSCEGSAPGQVDSPTLQKAIDAVNQQLAPRAMRVEFQYDDKANRVFVNLLDAKTGQLLLEIPPDGVRRILEGDVGGIISDETI
ncbi:flagellar protein FlaG [Alicyclobacillus kakegawensis]|uniref:flagellar protein FlaG n=1 Tax=Alicyclobacillus kakegawensis TaxID=392012 RepID=UPI00082FD31C|nr:flagellar protein FlaG [Alicyclobacillus kakegawensis]